MQLRNSDEPPLAPLLPGEPRHIGRYRLLGRLGQGGMGTVYLGEDEAGSRVAVKVIKPELSQHESFRIRFRREADAARRVRRFCTATVVDAALEGSQLYVVTEYVPGPTLEAAVREAGPLSGSTLEALAVGVATALVAIHGAGVVHRDLKPSNVLLSPVGPRVIDFGIARALDSVAEVTRTGEVVGTPSYIAPEALRGEPVTPACDVFSWGCLMVFAGTGHPPFGGETLPALMHQILTAEPRLEGLEPGLCDVVARALTKDPQQRPTAPGLLNLMVGTADAEDLARALALDWPREAPAALPAEDMAGTAEGTRPDADRRPPDKVPEPDDGRRRNRRRLVIGAGAWLAVLVLAVVFGPRLLEPGRDSPAKSPSGHPQSGNVVFRDDFSQRTGWDGWTYSPAEGIKRGFDSGVYTMLADSGYPENLSVAPLSAADAPAGGTTPEQAPGSLAIGVEAEPHKRTRAPGEYGVLCHVDENNTDYYEFTVDLDGGTRIRRAVQGTVRDLAQPVRPDGLNPRDPTRIQASCVHTSGGTHLVMWVNGQKVQEVTDPGGLPDGGVGLITRVPEKSTGVVETSFDDFTVIEPG